MAGLLLTHQWGILLTLWLVYYTFSHLVLPHDEEIKELDSYLHGNYYNTIRRLEGLKGKGRFTNDQIEKEQQSILQQLMYNYPSVENTTLV